MDPRTRRAVHALVFALMYVILFLILLPALIKVLEAWWGKVLYGGLVAGAVGVAYNLRRITRDDA